MSQLKGGVLLSYFQIILLNGTGLLLTPYIVKSLGTSEYGLYTLIGSLISYISVLDLGLNNTVIRFVSKYRVDNNIEEEKSFLGSIFIIYALISLTILLIGLYMYQYVDVYFQKALNNTELTKAKTMIQILIFNLIITLPGGVFTSICNAYEHFIFPRFINILKVLTRAFLIFSVLIYGGKSVSIVIVDTVLNILVIAITIVYCFSKIKIRISFNKLQKTKFLQIFKYSLWIFLMTIVGQFFWNTGQIILGSQTNTTLIAIYGIGITLGGYYGAFAGAVNSVFLPRATKMSLQNSKEDILKEMIKIGRIVTIILFFILFAFLFFGRDFIDLWVGVNYAKSWYVALFIMIVYTIPLIQNFAHSLLEAENKVAFKFFTYLVFIILGTLLGKMLVAQYGVTGMAFGISLGWFIAQLILNLYFYYALKINIKVFFKNIFITKLCLSLLISSLISLLFLLIKDNNWYIFGFKVLFFTIIYFVPMYFFGINEYERQLILQVLKLKNNK